MDKSSHSNPFGLSETTAKAAWWVIIIGGTIAILMFFKSFLRPVITAVVLWYLILELRVLISRIIIKGIRCPDWLSSLISSVSVLVVIYVTINILVSNIEKLSKNFPEYSENTKQLLMEIEAVTGTQNLDEWFGKQTQGAATNIAKTAGSFAGFLGKFFLIIIYLIFIFIEEKSFNRKLKLLLKKSENPRPVYESLMHINKLFHNYVSVKILTSFLTGLLSYLVLLLIGIDLPALWAFIIFLLNFIPSIGSIVATLFPALFAILQYGDMAHFFQVVIGVGVIQLLVGNFLEPRLMGNRLNISPLIILISLTFWGFIWGIVGMVLSVPIMAMMIIIFSQFQSTKSIAIILSKNGELDFGPPDAPREQMQKSLRTDE